MFEYLLYKIITFISLTFPLRFTYWVALRVADLHYLFDGTGRSNVKKNIRRILGTSASEASVTYEARWAFRHFGKYLGEFFRFSKFDKGFLEKYVALDGLHHVDDALKNGKGCIILAAHFCNWELGGCTLALLKYPINAVAREHTNRWVNDLFWNQRIRKGIKVFSIGSAVRSCYEALARNEIVAILGDRDFSDKGVVVDFFGKKAVFPRGPAHFALRTGAPLVPAFIVRRSNDAFILRFHPPIATNPGRPRQEQIEDIIQRFARTLEEYIYWNPSLWCVFDDFWEGPMRRERPLSTFRKWQ